MALKAIKGARVYDIDESAINDFVGRGFRQGVKRGARKSFG